MVKINPVGLLREHVKDMLILRFFTQL